MSNSAPSLEEFMVNPGKYEDFELIIDDAGKFKVVLKAEARRRQDRQVLTKIYNKGSGGFFKRITLYMPRAENF